MYWICFANKIIINLDWKYCDISFGDDDADDDDADSFKIMSTILR